MELSTIGRNPFSSSQMAAEPSVHSRDRHFSPQNTSGSRIRSTSTKVDRGDAKVSFQKLVCTNSGKSHGGNRLARRLDKNSMLTRLGVGVLELGPCRLGPVQDAGCELKAVKSPPSIPPI